MKPRAQPTKKDASKLMASEDGATPTINEQLPTNTRSLAALPRLQFQSNISQSVSGNEDCTSTSDKAITPRLDPLSSSAGTGTVAATAGSSTGIKKNAASATKKDKERERERERDRDGDTMAVAPSSISKKDRRPSLTQEMLDTANGSTTTTAAASYSSICNGKIKITPLDDLHGYINMTGGDHISSYSSSATNASVGKVGIGTGDDNNLTSSVTTSAASNNNNNNNPYNTYNSSTTGKKGKFSTSKKNSASSDINGGGVGGGKFVRENSFTSIKANLFPLDHEPSSNTADVATIVSNERHHSKSATSNMTSTAIQHREFTNLSRSRSGSGDDAEAHTQHTLGFESIDHSNNNNNNSNNNTNSSNNRNYSGGSGGGGGGTSGINSTASSNSSRSVGMKKIIVPPLRALALGGTLGGAGGGHSFSTLMGIGTNTYNSPRGVTVKVGIDSDSAVPAAVVVAIAAANGEADATISPTASGSHGTLARHGSAANMSDTPVSSSGSSSSRGLAASASAAELSGLQYHHHTSSDNNSDNTTSTSTSTNNNSSNNSSNSNAEPSGTGTQTKLASLNRSAPPPIEVGSMPSPSKSKMASRQPQPQPLNHLLSGGGSGGGGGSLNGSTQGSPSNAFSGSSGHQNPFASSGSNSSSLLIGSFHNGAAMERHNDAVIQDRLMQAKSLRGRDDEAGAIMHKFSLWGPKPSAAGSGGNSSGGGIGIGIGIGGGSGVAGPAGGVLMSLTAPASLNSALCGSGSGSGSGNGKNSTSNKNDDTPSAGGSATTLANIMTFTQQQLQQSILLEQQLSSGHVSNKDSAGTTGTPTSASMSSTEGGVGGGVGGGSLISSRTGPSDGERSKRKSKLRGPQAARAAQALTREGSMSNISERNAVSPTSSMERDRDREKDKDTNNDSMYSINTSVVTSSNNSGTEDNNVSKSRNRSRTSSSEVAEVTTAAATAIASKATSTVSDSSRSASGATTTADITEGISCGSSGQSAATPVSGGGTSGSGGRTAISFPHILAETSGGGGGGGGGTPNMHIRKHLGAAGSIHVQQQQDQQQHDQQQEEHLHAAAMSMISTTPGGADSVRRRAKKSATSSSFSSGAVVTTVTTTMTSLTPVISPAVSSGSPSITLSKTPQRSAAQHSQSQQQVLTSKSVSKTNGSSVSSFSGVGSGAGAGAGAAAAAGRGSGLASSLRRKVVGAKCSSPADRHQRKPIKNRGGATQQQQQEQQQQGSGMSSFVVRGAAASDGTGTGDNDDVSGIYTEIPDDDFDHSDDDFDGDDYDDGDKEEEDNGIASEVDDLVSVAAQTVEEDEDVQRHSRTYHLTLEHKHEKRIQKLRRERQDRSSQNPSVPDSPTRGGDSNNHNESFGSITVASGGSANSGGSGGSSNSSKLGHPRYRSSSAGHIPHAQQIQTVSLLSQQQHGTFASESADSADAIISNSPPRVNVNKTAGHSIVVGVGEVVVVGGSGHNNSSNKSSNKSSKNSTPKQSPNRKVKSAGPTYSPSGRKSPPSKSLATGGSGDGSVAAAVKNNKSDGVADTRGSHTGTDTAPAPATATDTRTGTKATADSRSSVAKEVATITAELIQAAAAKAAANSPISGSGAGAGAGTGIENFHDDIRDDVLDDALDDYDDDADDDGRSSDSASPTLSEVSDFELPEDHHQIVLHNNNSNQRNMNREEEGEEEEGGGGGTTSASATNASTDLCRAAAVGAACTAADTAANRAVAASASAVAAAEETAAAMEAQLRQLAAVAGPRGAALAIFAAAAAKAEENNTKRSNAVAAGTAAMVGIAPLTSAAAPSGNHRLSLEPPSTAPRAESGGSDGVLSDAVTPAVHNISQPSSSQLLTSAPPFGTPATARKIMPLHSEVTPGASSTAITSTPGGANAVGDWKTAPKLRWRKGEQVGEGTFGKVYKGLNEDTGELLAIKQLYLVDGSFSEAANLGREISVMWELHHEHIVQYRDTAISDRYLFIIMEFVTGGSIAGMLEQYGTLSDGLIRRFTKHIMRGVQYLHSKGIIHRDIKGANVLVTEQGVAKLADFGCSKQLQDMCTASVEESLKAIRGSVPWMAPEVIKQSGHGRSSDIWSVGATVIEMATGRPPWPEFSNNLAALFHVATSKVPPDFPPNASPMCTDFLSKCLVIDPIGRCSADELMGSCEFMQE